MAPRTRKAKEEQDNEEEQVEDCVKPGALPTSDESYSRKIFVSKSGTLANSKVVKLRHPKEGCALYRIGKDCFDEIFSIDPENRSWFYGDSVIENGTLYMSSPYNPLFVILPYLEKNGEKFLEIGEILKDDEYAAISELADNERCVKLLEHVADVKDAIDTKVYRLNKEKMMNWIEKKFENLKKQFSNEVHKTLLDSEDAYNRYVFVFLTDFLSPQTSEAVRTHLGIKETVVVENVDMSMKRKIMNEDDEIPKPVVKKPKESVAAKRLQAASKGTKSLSSFFTKKT